jgi:prevent-host-death family protein
MKETISTLEIRQKLGELLNRVALRHDEFVIQRKGKPLAAIVPVEKLEQLDRLARLGLREALDRPKRPISQEAADRLADEAKHRSRAKSRD